MCFCGGDKGNGDEDKEYANPHLTHSSVTGAREKSHQMWMPLKA